MRFSKYVFYGILLLLLNGCFSLAEQLYQRIHAARPLGSDDITVFERRFVQVKKDLPAFGTIGYTTNQFEGSFKEYTLTVYTLSPVMPVPGPHSEVMIGNLVGPVETWGLPKNSSVTLFRNYGNGIVLFRNPEK